MITNKPVNTGEPMSKVWLRDWGVMLILGVGSLVFAAYGWLLLYLDDLGTRAVVSDFATLAIAVATTVVAWRTAAHPQLDIQTRRAWRFIAASVSSYTLATILWLFYEVVLHQEPFPSWADVGYLGFYVFLLVGSLCFPMAQRSKTERRAFWLDVSTVMLGGSIAVWYFVLRPTILNADNNLLSTVLSLAYPVGDLVVLFGTLSLVYRRPSELSRQPLRLLISSMLLNTVADLFFAYQLLQGTYITGSVTDGLFVVAFFGIGLSCCYQHRQASQSRADAPTVPARRARTLTLLPYLAVLVGYGLLLVVTVQQWSAPLGGLVVGAVALTVLVVVRQIVVVRDNARLLLEQVARQSEARFRAMVQNSSDAIVIVDAAGVTRYQTPSVTRIFGYDRGALVGYPLADMLHPDNAMAKAAFLPALSSTTTTPVEWQLRHPDGSLHYIETTSTNLLDEPDVRGIVLNSRDITDRKLMEALLTHQASHDPLTNLPNRALFMDRLQHALDKRAHDQRVIAVLFLDLDNFKVINDSFGHQVGDQLLLAVAERLKASLRADDVAAHLGGDEFTLLLQHIGSQADAITAAERISTVLQQPFDLPQHQVVISASIGIVVIMAGDSQPVDVLRDADVAMYVGKKQGKASYTLFDVSMKAAAQQRLELERDLRQAIAHHEFRVYYQPIIALDDNQLIGLEALIRWQHPQRGLVAPAEFIPLAEETGLILPIGLWVLGEACRQVRAWQRAYPQVPSLGLSVNLSAKQFQQPTLADDVAACLHASGLAPCDLKLEITESVFMQDAELTIKTLQRLKALGIQLAMDDFGTGYSSLAYLKRFPIDVLKIDRSFVDELDHDGQDQAIVRAVVAFAQTMQLSVTAEGIETLAQLNALRRLGCEFGQGYFFARPQPPAITAALLAQTAGCQPAWDWAMPQTLAA